MLRRLLADRVLAISSDVSLVRTFSLRYWFAGLGERGGALGAVGRAVRRVLPPSLSLSLSLGDERVVLARKAAPVAAPANAARGRAADAERVT